MRHVLNAVKLLTSCHKQSLVGHYSCSSCYFLCTQAGWAQVSSKLQTLQAPKEGCTPVGAVLTAAMILRQSSDKVGGGSSLDCQCVALLQAAGCKPHRPPFLHTDCLVLSSDQMNEALP